MNTDTSNEERKGRRDLRALRDTDRKILDAAMKTFAREGYAGATTKKIAEEAGINEVTLFRRFQSKENILYESINRTRDTALETLNEIFRVERDRDIAVSLKALGRSLMVYMDEREDFILLLMTAGWKDSEIEKALSSIPQTLITRLSEYFKERIEAGEMREVDPEIAAITLFSYLLRESLAKDSLRGTYINKETAYDSFVDIFTKGILKD